MTQNQKTARPRLILLSVAGLLLLAALDQTIVATALPTIVADLGGLEHISWVITAYIIATTITAPVYGKLGDLYGRKRVIQFAVIVFLIGSALCGLAQSMTWLIVARAIQGLGGGGLFVLAFSVVADVVPPRQRGRIQGLFAAVFGFSSVAGPLLGGYFVDNFSWHWIFLINLPVGISSLVIFALAFQSGVERKTRKIDYLGAIALSVFLTAMVLLTSIDGETLPSGSFGFYGLISVMVFGFLVFVFAETRADEPILPLTLFQFNNFTTFAIIGFLFGVIMIGTISFMPVFLQVALRQTPTQSGVQLIPMMLGILVGATVSGQYMTRVGRYRILPIAGAFLLIAGLLMLAKIGVDTTILYLSIALLLTGMGIGPVMSVGTTAVQNAVEPKDIGAATAGNLLFRQVGGALGVALFGVVITSSLSAGLLRAKIADVGLDIGAIRALPAEEFTKVAQIFSEAIHPIFYIGLVMAVLAMITCFFVKEIPLRDGSDALAPTPTGDDLMAGTNHSHQATPTMAPNIVLVRPQMGENIGAAARAMWNFGLDRMVLVDPRDGWPNPAATALASGAAPVLDNIRVKPDINAALDDFDLVYATTARTRDMSKSVLSPNEAMLRARAATQSGKRVALLFGPERAGLENADIQRADALISVPVNPAFGSLNLAQCVLLLAYEWRLSEGQVTAEYMEWAQGVPASQDDRRHLVQRIEKQLDAISFFWPESKAESMRESFRNMFYRMPLSDIDVRTLHGIFRALDRDKPFPSLKNDNSGSAL